MLYYTHTLPYSYSYSTHTLLILYHALFYSTLLYATLYSSGTAHAVEPPPDENCPRYLRDGVEKARYVILAQVLY
jgi:hypothetical protein